MNKIIEFIKKEQRIIIMYLVLVFVSYIISSLGKEGPNFFILLLINAIILSVVVLIDKFNLELFFWFKFLSNILIYDNINAKRIFNKFYNFYFNAYCFFLIGFIIYICASVYLNSDSSLNFFSFKNFKSVVEFIFNTINSKFTWILIVIFIVKYNFKLVNWIFLYVLGLCAPLVFVVWIKYEWSLIMPIYFMFALIYSYLFIFKNDLFSLSKETKHKNTYHFNYREKVFINTKNKIELDGEYNNLLPFDKFKKHFQLFKEKSSSLPLKWNYIEPLKDDPINMGEDIFWFEPIAKNIYNLLNWINTSKIKGSYSIWITWEWWWWKSSVVNLLEQEYVAGNFNFLVYKFNPWNYEKKDLIERFFLDLWKILWKNEFSKLILKYLNLISWLHDKLNIASIIIKLFVKEKTIEDIKEDIGGYISELDKKIIVIIDDLDRCEPGEVIIMLNLIKNLWNFQNVIYLVSYDKLHIIKILEDKWFDKDYLEKIINIEVSLPTSNDKELKEYFKYQLKNILLRVNITQDIIDSSISGILNSYSGFFRQENMRFIKKLLNQLSVLFQLNHEINQDYVSNLNADSISRIFLINYIKLKDINFFNEVLKYSDYIKNNAIEYNSENSPKYLRNLKEKYIYREFIGICWIDIHNVNNKEWLSNGDRFEIHDIMINKELFKYFG